MIRFLTATALVFGLCLAIGRAGDFQAEPGFVSLFNGKDLSGWKYGKDLLDGKTETPDKRFTVENGVIVANEGKGVKDLYTARDFNKNFQLRLEFRAALKADSGVYLRGPQLQVRDYARRGERKQLMKFKNDDWNELDITVKSGQLVALANGKAVADKDHLEVTVKNGKAVARLNGKDIDIAKIDVSVASIARCLCNGEFLEDMPVPAKSDKGIGLQAETGKFEFRRVRVKELP